jgi:Arc/MetJ family transcription regulator
VGRTNVVIDERLIRRIMRIYGFRTKREAIDYALRRLDTPLTQKDMLDLEGSGWEGDLDEMRRSPVPES